jgi:hypothetical protein
MLLSRTFTIYLIAVALENAFLLVSPAKAQTLLETWVFLSNSGLFHIEDLKQRPDGTVTEPYHPHITGGEAIRKLKEQQNCVIRKENKNGVWVEYYLNNVLPDHSTKFFPDWGSYTIRLFGDTTVSCVYDPSTKNKNCYKTFGLDVLDDEELLIQFERAIHYVYTEFCHYARPSKPF